MVLVDQMQLQIKVGEGASGGITGSYGWNSGGGGGGGGYVTIYTNTPLTNIQLTDAMVYAYEP